MWEKYDKVGLHGLKCYILAFGVNCIKMKNCSLPKCSLSLYTLLDPQSHLAESRDDVSMMHNFTNLKQISNF